MRRKIRYPTLLLTLAAVMAAGWTLARGFQDDGSWARVERRDLVIGVEVEGELRSVDSALLGPPAQVQDVWNFKISWMGPEGKEVREGEPVLRFDTTELDRRLQEKRVEGDSAQKNLEKTETDLEVERRQLELTLAEAEARRRRARLKLDVPEDVEARLEIAKAQIDERLAQLEIDSIRSKLEHLKARSKADLRALANKRDRARARVAAIEADVARMTVTAPRAGSVIYVTDWRGEKPKVGDRVWRMRKVMEIPDLTRMLADGEVAEADGGRLAEGQAVTLRLDAHPDHEYRGTVRLIRRSVQQKSRRNPKKYVRLEIELDETDTERMRPGMRFRGAVEVERQADSLLVPQEAVVARDDGAVVYVRTLLGRREVEPTFGGRNREEFAVVEGLAEGDWVLVGGSTEGEDGT